jgi:hypothetical protein
MAEASASFDRKLKVAGTVTAGPWSPPMQSIAMLNVIGSPAKRRVV